MPETKALVALGRVVELAGWATCLGGLALAFWLVAGGHLPAALAFDRPLAATLIGALAVLPGLGLILVGSSLAGAKALSPGWITALMARRPMTKGRRLTVLVCLLIAALCLAAIASLWPEIRDAFG